MDVSGLPDEQIYRIVDAALAEDVSHGDVTTEVLIPVDLRGTADILVKDTGILAGGFIAEKVFGRIDSSLKFELYIKDGAEVKEGDVIASVSGKIAGILKAERVALNFLQRLSGIATQTAEYVDRVRGTDAYVADTRKTTPGLRILEKYAVRMGGGKNHRFHLSDGILIKDNHLAVLYAQGMTLKQIIEKAKANAPEDVTVEVEVTSIQEALEADGAGADIIMLDNMSNDEMRQVVKTLKGKVKLEASGGISMNSVRAVAETGIDYFSVGGLTHSVKALDISLEIVSLAS